MPSASPSRVDLLGEAADLLRRLSGLHGLLLFHQSGGCCDGSSPMCFPVGDFITSEADVHLADLVVDGLEEPVGFWMSASQYAYWKHTHRTVDVVRGRGAASPSRRRRACGFSSARACSPPPSWPLLALLPRG